MSRSPDSIHDCVESLVSLFIDVPTAARLLDLGLTTTWNMVRSGELPSRRFGRSVKIPRAAIEKIAREANEPVAAS